MKNEPQAIHTEAPTHSPWPRRLIILFIMLLPFGILFQAWLYFHWAGSGELQQTIAELDQNEPAWRIEDIEAKRRVLADAENSALIVRAISGIEQRGSGLLPDVWPDPNKSKVVDDLPPEIQLSAFQIEFVRGELKKAEAALKEAQRLVDMPYGRYPITYAKDGWSTLLPHTQGARRCGNLLWYHTLNLLHEGKTDEAMNACRAMLNTSRAIADEPTLISMLVRIAVRVDTVDTIERVLAQGEPSEISLALLQKELERDVHEPLFYYGALGERALSDRMMQAIENGDVPLGEVLRTTGALSGKGAFIDSFSVKGYPAVENILNGMLFVWKAGPIKHNRRMLLKYNTSYVEIAKMPFVEQDEKLQDLEGTIQDQPPLVRSFVSGGAKVNRACHRGRALMHSAIAALAAERYRKKHGKWPEKLSDLTPEFMSDVPNDPFSKGNPLRFVKRADGLVIYSVGMNGTDEGGVLGRVGSDGGLRTNADFGFQLFEPTQRRRPPLPGTPKVEEDE